MPDELVHYNMNQTKYEEQAGFRKDRNTVQQIRCLKMIAEKYREVDKVVCNCYVFIYLFI